MPEPVTEQSSPYIQEQASNSPRHDKPMESGTQQQVRHTLIYLFYHAFPFVSPVSYLLCEFSCWLTPLFIKGGYACHIQNTIRMKICRFGALEVKCENARKRRFCMTLFSHEVSWVSPKIVQNHLYSWCTFDPRGHESARRSLTYFVN